MAQDKENTQAEESVPKTSKQLCPPTERPTTDEDAVAAFKVLRRHPSVWGWTLGLLLVVFLIGALLGCNLQSRDILHSIHQEGFERLVKMGRDAEMQSSNIEKQLKDLVTVLRANEANLVTVLRANEAKPREQIKNALQAMVDSLSDSPPKCERGFGPVGSAKVEFNHIPYRPYPMTNHEIGGSTNVGVPSQWMPEGYAKDHPRIWFPQNYAATEEPRAGLLSPIPRNELLLIYAMGLYGFNLSSRANVFKDRIGKLIDRYNITLDYLALSGVFDEKIHPQSFRNIQDQVLHALLETCLEIGSPQSATFFKGALNNAKKLLQERQERYKTKGWALPDNMFEFHEWGLANWLVDAHSQFVEICPKK